MYRKSVGNVESKERLGVVRGQRHEMHHLLSRYVVVRCMHMREMWKFWKRKNVYTQYFRHEKMLYYSKP
jgi:hypothetical protein